MNASMNAFRKHLSNDVSKLRDLVKSLIEAEPHDIIDTAAVVDAMNKVIEYSNFLNCFYYQDDDNFSDLSDKVHCEYLDL